MSLRSWFLTRLRDRITGDQLPLRLTFWDGEIFEFAAKPQVTITLLTPRLMRYFADRRRRGAGSGVCRRIVMPGDKRGGTPTNVVWKGGFVRNLPDRDQQRGCANRSIMRPSTADNLG